MHKILVEQYNFTAQRCRRVFLEHGSTERDMESSERVIQVNQSDEAANMALLAIISKVVSKRKVHDLLELNSLVREFQALVNHCVYTDGGDAMTRALWLAQETVHDSGGRVPRDWEERFSMIAPGILWGRE